MRFLKEGVFLFFIALVLSACSSHHKGKITSYSVYNSGKQAIFPVTSTIFYTDNEAMLVDAQFNAQDAQNIVNQIKRSGKPLTLIYISQADPDFYFGLNTILAAYPNARVAATAETVARIKQNSYEKMNYWRKQLGKQVPVTVYIPTIITDNQIQFGSETFEIKGNNPYRTYLWLPSKKMIVGGSLLSNDMFVWTADAKSISDRINWNNCLVEMLALQPEIAIPGHYLGIQPKGIEAIDFTRQYLKTYDYVLLSRSSKQDIISSMKRLYPDLGGEINLDMSTDIILGHLKFD